MHSAPAVWHDRTELCVPVQKQVTLRTSLPVSGLEMVCSALRCHNTPFLFAFLFVKLSLQRDSSNWDSRATVASSPRGLLSFGTLTSLKDALGRGQQVCVAKCSERWWGGGLIQGWEGGVAWKPTSAFPGVLSSCLSWLCVNRAWNRQGVTSLTQHSTSAWQATGLSFAPSISPIVR